jgi:hypothetical protein
MRQLTELQPGNIAMRYNLALTIAAQSTAANDRDAEAATLIVRAIDDGFSDARRILRDPMLERVREHAQLRAMLQDWAKVQETQREALLAAAQQEFPSCTHRVTLEELRIELITHLPQDEAGLIAGELAKVHEFVTRHALPSNEQLGIDRLIERDSATNPNAAALWSDPWSIIIIPDAQDYKGWTNRMFGGANPNLGAAGAIDTSCVDARRARNARGRHGPSRQRRVLSSGQLAKQLGVSHGRHPRVADGKVFERDAAPSVWRASRAHALRCGAQHLLLCTREGASV